MEDLYDSFAEFRKAYDEDGLTPAEFTSYGATVRTLRQFLGANADLEAFVRDTLHWTFWPSLVATLALLALGEPLLWLFGPQFTSGYGIMFVAAIGLMVRAAIGPVERLLNMLGHQHVCALAYALSFAVNLALCLVLVPRWGGTGAAASTSAPHSWGARASSSSMSPRPAWTRGAGRASGR